MPLYKVQIAPGIDKQDTEYGAEGRWIDSDNIRFRYGLPEKIGGWQSIIGTTLIGAARDQHTWTDLAGEGFDAIGTNRKLYVYYDGVAYDVTPLSTTIPAVFTFTSGTTIVDVLATSHGAVLGDCVTFSTVSGVNVVNISNTTMENEFEIVEVTDTNNIKVDVADLGVTPGTVTASGTAAGAAFQINVGPDISASGLGFGAGGWGLGTWSSPSQSVSVNDVRIWQLDNFGEDLIATAIGGRTYYLDTSAFKADTTTRATELANAPDRSNYMIVSARDRHLIFLGTETTPGSSTSYDPMAVLFGSQESITDFTPTAVNTAGFQRLSSGNEIVTAVRTRGDVLILTDNSAHSMQYVGPPYTFSFNQIGSNCGATGPHVAVEAENVVYWMSDETFFLFDGTVKELPCSVQDYIFDDFNFSQRTSNFAGVDLKHGEINWFYASANSTYINRLVTYSYKEKVWTVGSLARTTWKGADVFEYPLATRYSPNSTVTATPTVIGVTEGRSNLYNHEIGTNADGEAMTAYVQSGDIDIADGEDITFIKRYIPDFKNQQGALTMTFKVRQYPGSSQVTASTATVYSTTTKIDTRVRGRQVGIRIESNSTNNVWRFGTLRVDGQPDGKR